MYKIESYTDKSIAVFGDTRSIKDVLTALGGKFNMNLRGQPGWIFPKSKETEVKAAISSRGRAQDEEDFEDEEAEAAPPKLKRLLIAKPSVSSGVPRSLSFKQPQEEHQARSFKRPQEEQQAPDFSKILEKLLNSVNRIEDKLDKIINKNV